MRDDGVFPVNLEHLMRNASAHRVLRALYHLACIVVGLILVSSGVLKLFDLEPTVEKIQRMTDIPHLLSLALSVVLVVVETGCGAFLLMRRRVDLAGLVAASLFCLFVLVVATDLLKRETVVCGCLGPLNLPMTAETHLLLNIVLFAMVLPCSFYAQPRSSPMKTSAIGLDIGRFFALKSTLAVVMVTLVIGNVARVWLDPATRPEVDAAVIVNAFEAEENTREQGLAVFLVDLDDFYCPACLDDFLAITRRLAALDTWEVRILARQEPGRPADKQRLRLDIWRRQVDVPFAMVLDEDNLFAEAGLERSSLFLFSPDYEMLFTSTIPVSPDVRAQMLDYMTSAEPHRVTSSGQP